MTAGSVTAVRPLGSSDVHACAAVLAELPEWFGMPEANAAYVESLHRLPGFVAVERERVVGFLAVDRQTAVAAEITVMGVLPDRHRTGVGRALVDTAVVWCGNEGIDWLHVKTRGPSTYDDDYERTRRFYIALGFAPLFESIAEWGPGNAALVLVRHLECASRRIDAIR